MNRPIPFTPWLVDWHSVIYALLGGAILILLIYLATRGGRELRGEKQTPGKPPVRTYAGILKSDASPATVFVLFFSVAAFIWAIWYIIRMGILGLRY